MFNPSKLQLLSVEMFMDNFGICYSFFKREGLCPKRDTYLWETLWIEGTIQFKLFCFFSFTNSNIPMLQYFLEEITNHVISHLCMDFTIKQPKNMEITMFGTILMILLTIYLLRLQLRARYFVFMVGSLLNELLQIQSELQKGMCKSLPQDHYVI